MQTTPYMYLFYKPPATVLRSHKMIRAENVEPFYFTKEIHEYIYEYIYVLL